MGFLLAGSGASFTVVALVAALVLVPLGLRSLVGDPTEPVAEGGHVELADNITLTAPSGWEKDLSASDEETTVLTDGVARASFTSRDGVVDTSVFFQRQVRLLRLAGIKAKVRDVHEDDGEPTVVTGLVRSPRMELRQTVMVDDDDEGLAILVSSAAGGLDADAENIDELLAGVEFS